MNATTMNESGLGMAYKLTYDWLESSHENFSYELMNSSQQLNKLEIIKRYMTLDLYNGVYKWRGEPRFKLS